MRNGVKVSVLAGAAALCAGAATLAIGSFRDDGGSDAAGTAVVARTAAAGTTAAVSAPAVTSPAEDTGTRTPGKPSATTALPGVDPEASVPPSADIVSPAPADEQDAKSPGAQPQDSPAPRPRADVSITYLAWSAENATVQASGFSTPLEPSGTCRLTLTSPGGRVVTAERAALPDVSSMACGGLEVPRAELSAGRWTVSLTYSSQTSSGTSPASEVVVP